MKGIAIGAGQEAVNSIQKAKAMGHYTIAVDGNAKAEGLQYADFALAADIKAHMQVVEALKDFMPDFIIPVPIGRYLTCTGCVADYFDLKGISYESSILCTDKYLFHIKMREKGLRNISCFCIPAGEIMHTPSLDSAASDSFRGNGCEMHFPVIAKPRFGSGSRGVLRIDDRMQLETFYKNLPYDEDYVIEDMIEGIEYGIDAAVADGHFCLILLRRKILTPPPSCQCVAYASIKRKESNRLLFEKIEQYMQEAVEVLGLKHCLLHADIIIGKAFEPMAVEISGRPSGHRLHDIFTPLASGVDMVKEFIHYSLDQPYCYEPEKVESLAIRYFDFEDCRVVRQPSLQELQKKYDLLAYQCNIHDEVQKKVLDGASIMHRGYFILKGTDDEDALRQCREIIGLFELDYDIS